MIFKNKKTLTSIILLLCIMAGSMYLPGQEIRHSSNQNSSDTLQIVIQDKITFYQSEQNKNAEAIEALQKELEQRRSLNERLNGAVAAAQEILILLQERISGPPGAESKE